MGKRIKEVTLEEENNIVHGIGDKFKFSRKAFREKEFDKTIGDLDKRNVEVIDRDKNTGKIFHFIWNIGKSNDNIDDTREGKGGFSFYLSRYVYYDIYKMEVPDLVEAQYRHERTAYVGQIFDPERPHARTKTPVAIVIQLKEEKRDRIRIISSYMKDLDHGITELYYDRALKMARKGAQQQKITLEKTVIEGPVDDPPPGEVQKAINEIMGYPDDDSEIT